MAFVELLPNVNATAPAVPVNERLLLPAMPPRVAAFSDPNENPLVGTDSTLFCNAREFASVRDPREMVVVPVKVFAPLKDTLMPALISRFPDPEMTLVNVCVVKPESFPELINRTPLLTKGPVPEKFCPLVVKEALRLPYGVVIPPMLKTTF